MSVLGYDAEAAEREVIAAALSPGGAAVVSTLSAQEHLNEKHFANPVFSTTWKVCLDRLARDEAITMELVMIEVDPIGDRISYRDILARAVGAGYGAISALRSYARLVIRGAERRSWAAAAEALKDAALNDDETGLRRAEELLRTNHVTQDTFSAEELGYRVMKWLTETGTPPAISSGFPGVDEKIGGGFRPGDLTFIGGHTSQGKSSLVDGFLTHAVISSSKRVHVFANEMSPEDRTLRIVADLSGVPYGRLASRSPKNTDWPRLLDAGGRVPFSITRANQWSVDQICRDVYHNRYDLWAVDHLHNMQYRDREELEGIVRTLAACASSTGTHCILVGQLNEGRNATDIPPFPAMRDIRDTGMIKHIASQVFMIHRDHRREDDEVQIDTAATLSFPKARHGETGSIRVELNTVRLRFHGAYPEPTETLSFTDGDGVG